MTSEGEEKDISISKSNPQLEREKGGFMNKCNLQVNSWWTEYVYEMFWECLSSTGNVNMALR